MDRTQLVGGWIGTLQSGSLITSKHDPNNLSTTHPKDRSILTHEASASLEEFLQSGKYQIDCYHDADYPKGAGYYVVTPSAESNFSVVGSGVPGGSTTPTGALDRLIFVSGSQQGWHVYAETGSFISGEVTAGRFTPSGSY